MAGGWGIDALLGRQTRDHSDVDLAIPGESEATAIGILAVLGYKPFPELDWRPIRLGLRDEVSRQVDLHPVFFDEHGDGTQANVGDLPPFQYSAGDFETGAIGGVCLPCISKRLQLQFHAGYTLSEKDQQDLDELRSMALSQRAPQS